MTADRLDGCPAGWPTSPGSPSPTGRPAPRRPTPGSTARSHPSPPSTSCASSATRASRPSRPTCPASPPRTSPTSASRSTPPTPRSTRSRPPGRNQTQKLADSLAGSPRPTSCGTSPPATPCAASAATRATRRERRPTRRRTRPDATSTVHASTNRGILTRPYENRVLSRGRAVLRQQGLRPVPHLPHGDPLHEPAGAPRRPRARTSSSTACTCPASTATAAAVSTSTPRGPARATRAAPSATSTTTARPTLPSDPDGCPATGLVVFGPNVLPSKSMGGVPTFTKTATSGRARSPATARTTRAPRTATDPGASIGYVPVGG